MGEMQNPALDPWSGRARFSSDRTSEGPESEFQTRSKGPEQLEVGNPLSLNLLTAYKLVKKQPVFTTADCEHKLLLDSFTCIV